MKHKKFNKIVKEKMTKLGPWDHFLSVQLEANSKKKGRVHLTFH